MDIIRNKKSMTKEEVALLVDLVADTKVLTSKETNAATNKLKDEAWDYVTLTFNSRSSFVPRQKDQLKLKWDNLKKAARKRTQQIRMNQLKTGGGKSDFIPPDEILERVADLLGSTCTGFELPFGGDGVYGAKGVEIVNVEETEISFVHNEAEISSVGDCRPVEPILYTSEKKEVEKRKIEGGLFYGMPKMDKALMSPRVKRRKTYDDTGRKERNEAITQYYKKKTIKVDLEIELLKIQLQEKTNK